MGILRTVLERLGRGVVLRRRITVKGMSVPLFVSPDAQLKYLKYGSRAFDGDLIRLAETNLNRNSVVWDVGANVGVFTFAAAAVASDGVVVAIEADSWLVGLLRRTARLREYRQRQVAIVPVAVSSENSIGVLMVAARGRASNALETAGGFSQMGGVRERQYVATLTLDTILDKFPPPDFIKIDIEGAECMALQGATRIIRDIRPVFYIEVGSGNSAEVLRILQQADYVALDPERKGPLDACVPNTLFVPQEKLDTAVGR